MQFSLFVPRGLRRKREYGNAAWPELAGLPLALQSETGSFRRRLDREIAGAGVLEVHLECESFPMAAQAVRTGEFAAILPDVAGAFLPKSTTERVSFDPLKRCSYDLTLLWHRRTEVLRSGSRGLKTLSFGQICTALRAALQLQRLL
jgi:DNA-binding transcriptional LysR family regulator